MNKIKVGRSFFNDASRHDKYYIAVGLYLQDIMTDQWRSITTVEVVPYNPAWKDAYLREERLLREILDAEIVEIHHIGSTSVPGLPAKPVIDILIGVRRIEDLDLYGDAMAGAGYEVRGEFGLPGRRFYTKGIPKRTHNIHAFRAGGPEYLRHLYFRDYLIAHPEEARRYGEMKIALALTCNNDMNRYMDGKDAFVKEMERKAIAWAESR